MYLKIVKLTFNQIFHLNKFLQTDPVTSKINFSALDCLRGLAATYVVFNHARGHLFSGGNYLATVKPVQEWSFFEKVYVGLLQTTSLGHEFVIFFFILSGFSIAFSISRSNGIGGFYKRRLIRIYPPYLLGILWAIIVFLLIRSAVPQWLSCIPDNSTAKMMCSSVDFVSAKNILKNIFYMPNGLLLAQYWSLPCVMIFYLLIPLFIRSVKWYLIISFALYFAVIPFQGLSYHSSNIITDYFIHYNFYFAIGAWLFYYRGFLEKRLNAFSNKYVFIISALLIFFLMVLLNYYLGEDNFIIELLACLFSLLFIKYFLNNNYQPKLLAFLGKFSYTIYIGHVAAIYLFKVLLYALLNYDGSEITNRYIWLLGVIFAVACCYALYFVAERPSKNWLKKLRN